MDTQLDRRLGLTWSALSKTILALILTLTPVWSQAAATSVGEEPQELKVARDQVAKFHKTLLAAMDADGGFQARLQLLEPVIAEFLDVPTIARLCLGRTWRTLSEPQRQEFTAALGRLLSMTYADRFHTDNGQVFVTDEVLRSGGSILVKTHLQRPNGEPVQLDYYFRQGQAFNVVANGVSDLSLRRADYNAIIKQQGFAALVQHLVVQQAAFAATENSAN